MIFTAGCSLNPTHIAIDEIRRLINQYFNEKWFYSSEWKVPDLHFDNWDSEDDHFLHEFKSVEETIEESTSNITIDEFLSTIKVAKNHF